MAKKKETIETLKSRIKSLKAELQFEKVSLNEGIEFYKNLNKEADKSISELVIDVNELKFANQRLNKIIDKIIK